MAIVQIISTKTFKKLIKIYTNIFHISVIILSVGDYLFWSMLFGTKHKLSKIDSVDIGYGEIHIKQYHTVAYAAFS